MSTIDTLIGVPSAAQRIGSGSWQTNTSSSNRWGAMSAVSSTGSPTIPVLGSTDDWAWFGRYAVNVALNGAYPINVRIDANNFFRVEHRGASGANTIRASYRLGGSSGEAVINLAFASLGIGNGRLDGAVHIAVWKVGGTLWAAATSAADNAIVKGSAAIGHANNWANLVNGGRIFVSKLSDGNYSAPQAWYGLNMFVRFGGEFPLTDTQIQNVLMDPQQIDDMPGVLGVWSIGDLCDSDGDRVDNTGPIDLEAGMRLICPRTGIEAEIVSTADPAAGTAFPPYTNPGLRWTQWITQRPCQYATMQRGNMLVWGTHNRSTSTNRPHGTLHFVDVATMRECKWPLPIGFAMRYVDAGDGHTAKTLHTTHNLPSRLDMHQRCIPYLFDGRIVVVQTAQANRIPNWPTSGDDAMCHAHYKVIDDDDLMRDPVWISDAAAGDGPALPVGTAFGSASNAWQHYSVTYQYACRVGPWLVMLNRSRDTGPGYATAWAVRDDGLTRYRQLEITALSNSDFTGGIPMGAYWLGGDVAALVWNPRAGAGLGYPALNCALCRISGDGDSFNDPAEWRTPLAGDPLDGSGPDSLELAVNLTSDADAMNLYTENNGVALGSRDGVFHLSGLADAESRRIVMLLGIDAGNANGSRSITDLLIRVYRYDDSLGHLVMESSDSLHSWFLSAVGGTTALLNDSRLALQWTDAQRRGAVCMFNVLDGAALSAAEAPSGYDNRYGRIIRAVYFPDIKADPTNFVDLGTVFDRDDHPGVTGLSTTVVGLQNDWSTIVGTNGVVAVQDANDASAVMIYRDIDDLIEPHRIKDDGLAGYYYYIP